MSHVGCLFQFTLFSENNPNNFLVLQLCVLNSICIYIGSLLIINCQPLRNLNGIQRQYQTLINRITILKLILNLNIEPTNAQLQIKLRIATECVGLYGIFSFIHCCWIRKPQHSCYRHVFHKQEFCAGYRKDRM